MTTADDFNWEHISPHLDEAMAKLGEKDRDAVLLRYFENKTFAEVGTAMGTNEDAAQKTDRPRRGKIAALFFQTRRDVDSGGFCRSGVGQFDSSRARDVDKICDGRCDCQRRGGQRFNFNNHQRSIETYGMDKSKNGDCRGCNSIARGGNDNCNCKNNFRTQRE